MPQPDAPTERDELAGAASASIPSSATTGTAALVDLAHAAAGRRPGGGRIGIARRHGARISDTLDPAALRCPCSDLAAARALSALARRELDARYRGGALGFPLVPPEPAAAARRLRDVFRFVFAPRADVRPYALFLFGGVLVWGFVSAALLDASETFRANGPLLRKTTVAPEVFPAVAVAARLAHLLLALPVLAAAIAFAAWRGSVAPGRPLLQLPLVLSLLVGRGLRPRAPRLGARGPLRGRAGSRRQRPDPGVLSDADPLPAAAVPERFRGLLRLNPFASFLSAIHDSALLLPLVGSRRRLGLDGRDRRRPARRRSAVFERLRDSIAEEA